MTDERHFPFGTELRVLLNLQSFTNFGVVPLAGNAFTSLVKRTCEVWNSVGANVRFRDIQYTNIDSILDDNLDFRFPQDHVLVKMDEAILDAGFNVLGTGGELGRRGSVTLYYAGADLTPYDWTMGFAEGSGIEMFSVLLHEFGHILGLGHTEDDAIESIMHDMHKVRDYAGLSIHDIERLHALYGAVRHRRIRNIYAAGAGWIERSGNELSLYQPTSGGARNTSISHNIAATPFGTTPLYYCVWNDTQSRLNTVSGDGTDFLMNRTWTHWYPDSVKTLFGADVASTDDGATVLWAWVRSDWKLIIQRSTNHGRSWTWVNQSDDVHSCSRPCVISLDDSQPGTWIMFWSNYLTAYRYDELAVIEYMVSTDDGVTWSAPAMLKQGFRAVGGISASDLGGNQVAIAFSELPTSPGTLSYGKVKVERYQLNGAQLDYDRLLWSGSTATQAVTEPSLTRYSNKLLLTWKDSHATTIERTSIKTKILNLDSGSWTGVSDTQRTTTVAPTASFHPRWYERAIWYADKVAAGGKRLAVPTRLRDVLAGSMLVVVASVQELLASEVKRYGDQSRVESTIRLRIDDIIKGRLRVRSLKLRIIGGKVGNQVTDWQLPIEKPAQFLLLLKETRANGKKEYVLFHDHFFPIEAKDVLLKTHFRKELKESGIPVRRGRASLSAVKRMIHQQLKTERNPPRGPKNRSRSTKGRLSREGKVRRSRNKKRS